MHASSPVEGIIVEHHPIHWWLFFHSGPPARPLSAALLSAAWYYCQAATHLSSDQDWGHKTCSSYLLSYPGNTAGRSRTPPPGPGLAIMTRCCFAALLRVVSWTCLRGLWDDDKGAAKVSPFIKFPSRRGLQDNLIACPLCSPDAAYAIAMVLALQLE